MVFVKRAISVLKCMSLCYARRMAYVLCRFTQVIRIRDVAIDSARNFYLVNLALFACMLLLSPDKIPQMFRSTESGLAALDFVEEILAFLKRIVVL